MQTPAGDLVDGEALWHFALVAAELAAIFRARSRMGRGYSRAGFVRAMVATAEIQSPSTPARRASGRMVIEIGKDRRVIVDAGVDAAALARVLAILERR